MAQSTIPVLPAQAFPQLLALLAQHEIARVERVLGSCCHSDEYWSCPERAIVSDLNTGYGLCAFHFQEAHRGH